MSSNSFLEVGLGKISKKYSNLPVCSLDVLVEAKRLSLIIVFDHENFKLLYPKGKTIFLEYEEEKSNSAKLSWMRSDKKREKALRNQDFMAAFFQDFEFLMVKLSPSKLERFSARFFDENSKFLENFPRIFETTSKIRSTAVQFDVTSEDQISGILKFLNSDSLKFISVSTPGDSNEKILIDDVANLEQWKKAERLDMEDIDVMAGIRKFESFRHAEISFVAFPMDSVDELKEIFLHSPIPQKFHILTMSHLDLLPQLIDNYGQPFLDIVETTRTRKSWFFKVPNHPEQIIRISLFAVLMEFIRIPREEVPREASIIGEFLRF